MTTHDAAPKPSVSYRTSCKLTFVHPVHSCCDGRAFEDRARDGILELESELAAAKTDRDAHQREAIRVMAEAEALREALHKYGRHEESCPIVDESGDSFCTCGFSAALGGAK